MLKRAFTLLVPVLALATVLAAPAGADQVLTLETHQGAFQMQGQEQPARDATVEIWIGPDAVARDQEDSRVVLTESQLILVNHEAETYSVIDLPVDMKELLPEGMQEMADQMMQQARISAEVEAADETREINGWQSRLWTVTMSNAMGLNVSMKLWASDEVDVDPAPYRRLTEALSSLQPGGGEWVEKLSAIEGFPVLRETSMQMGQGAMNSSEELVSVEERDAPEGLYGAPEGYERKDFNPMQGAGAGPAQ